VEERGGGRDGKHAKTSNDAVTRPTGDGFGGWRRTTAVGSVTWSNYSR